MAFREVGPKNIPDSIFKLIGDAWMLLSAACGKDFNTMTASWATAGVLWNKPVVQAFVRPQRHTYGFMEKSPYFTCSFFNEEYRDALTFCGRNSGRDTDKMAATGLPPVLSEDSRVWFEEARLVLVCRKLYAQNIDPPDFYDDSIDASVYAKSDYHRAYFGEIVRCLVQE